MLMQRSVANEPHIDSNGELLLGEMEKEKERNEREKG